MEQEHILHQPLRDLDISENFYLRCKLMGFSHLAEIIRTPVETIIQKEDFNENWLGELAGLLISTGLLHRLQPLPGSFPART